MDQTLGDNDMESLQWIILLGYIANKLEIRFWIIHGF